MKYLRLYLAGPDVFLPNANDVFKAMEAQCAAAGFVGVRPTDGGLSQGVRGTPEEIAERIYQGNMALLRSCDGVLANMRPFRSAVEPDSGTVFETGVAIALGLPVHGYLPDCHQSLEEKISANFTVKRDENGIGWDREHGFMVEEFSQPMNLMLARSMTLHEHFADALAGIKNVLLPRSRCRP